MYLFAKKHYTVLICYKSSLLTDEYSTIGIDVIARNKRAAFRCVKGRLLQEAVRQGASVKHCHYVTFKR